MTKQTRRRFSPEYKEQSVARLSEPGATHSSVAAELGVTPTQLKTWRLELEAAGSAAATAAQKAEAAELVQLRRDNKRLTEEVEVLRKASAFFAQWARVRDPGDLRAEQEVLRRASDPCRVESPRLSHLEAHGRQAHARERHSSTARQAAGADHHRQPPLPCDRAQSARPQLRSRCARCGLAR